MGVLVLLALGAALSAPGWVPSVRWHRTARLLDVPRPFATTAKMRLLLRLEPARVYGAMLRARDAGVALRVDDATSLLLAGGHLERVVDALAAARAQGVPLTFAQAAALDLSGRNPLKVVQAAPRTEDGRIDYPRVLGGGTAGAPRLPDGR
jgi:uncharacterized protein YqfA (UPF0365 family)